jgi:hypothetical protein
MSKTKPETESSSSSSDASSYKKAVKSKLVFKRKQDQGASSSRDCNKKLKSQAGDQDDKTTSLHLDSREKEKSDRYCK